MLTGPQRVVARAIMRQMAARREKASSDGRSAMPVCVRGETSVPTCRALVFHAEHEASFGVGSIAKPAPIGPKPSRAFSDPRTAARVVRSAALVRAAPRSMRRRARPRQARAVDSAPCPSRVSRARAPRGSRRCTARSRYVVQRRGSRGDGQRGRSARSD